MPDKASSVVSGAGASSLPQTPIPVPSDHAGPGRIEETLPSMYAAAESAMSLDIAGIDALSATSCVRQHGSRDSILAATIGMRVAQLLTGISPAGGAAAERHGVRLPSGFACQNTGGYTSQSGVGR